MRTIAVLLFAPMVALSQTHYTNADLSRLRADIALQTIAEKGMRLDASWMSVPLVPPKTEGDTYVDKNFRKGNVIQVEDEKVLGGYSIRYDLYLDRLEFETEDGIRVLAGEKVASFLLWDPLYSRYRHFLRGNLLASSQEISGFVEILTEGAVPLLKKTVLVFRRANYRPELNVGERDNQILKKDEYFALFPDGVKKLPSGKKRFYASFGEKAIVLREYAHVNYLRHSKEEDLIRILNFLNESL